MQIANGATVMSLHDPPFKQLMLVHGDGRVDVSIQVV